MDGHTYGAESIIMNLDLYNGMTPEQQAWVDEAAAYARDTQRAAVDAVEAEYLQQIKDGGTIVCEDPDIQSFKDATADMYKLPEVAEPVSYTHLDVYKRQGRWVHQDWEELPEWRPDQRGEIRNRDFFGGDLLGVMEKLDYLKGLGVETLYFNPIFEASENHRYGTADYDKIDPMLGSNQDFSRL